LVRSLGPEKMEDVLCGDRVELPARHRERAAGVELQHVVIRRVAPGVEPE
jgi:hypothetical protein